MSSKPLSRIYEADVSSCSARRPPLKNFGTDILSTLFEVSDHLADAGDRQSTLLLMSDMIQAGNGVSFVKSINVTSLINKLRAGRTDRRAGRVVRDGSGADASRSGRQDPDFWQTYFHEAGANFSDRQVPSFGTRSESLFCAPNESELPVRPRGTPKTDN